MKIGNLFELADRQLQKELNEKKIPCYTALDIIEYATNIRKWLDKNHRKVKKITELTKEEKLKRSQTARMNHYYKKMERK